MPTTINFAQRSVGILLAAFSALAESEGVSFKVCKNKASKTGCQNDNYVNNETWDNYATCAARLS